MPNRPRPRCPDCGTAMDPVYRKGRRGAVVRLADVFACPDDGVVARGRRKPRYV